MTQEESNRLAELLVRKNKADKLPTTERLKYIDKYMDIIAEILEIQEKEKAINKPFNTLPLNIAIGFNSGLPYTNDAIDQYVWNQFKELCNSSSQSRKIMWKLRAVQEVSYKLEEELQ